MRRPRGRSSEGTEMDAPRRCAPARLGCRRRPTHPARASGAETPAGPRPREPDPAPRRASAARFRRAESRRAGGRVFREGCSMGGVLAHSRNARARRRSTRRPSRRAATGTGDPWRRHRRRSHGPSGRQSTHPTARSSSRANCSNRARSASAEPKKLTHQRIDRRIVGRVALGVAGVRPGEGRLVEVFDERAGIIPRTCRVQQSTSSIGVRLEGMRRRPWREESAFARGPGMGRRRGEGQSGRAEGRRIRGASAPWS